MNRRGFLKFFGTGAVAAPSMGQEAVKAMSLPEAGASGIMSNGMGLGPPTDAEFIPAAKRLTLLRRAFNKLGGLPKWKREELIRDSRYVHRMDMDIAELRSVSPVSKIRMQRQRTYDRLYQQEMEMPWLKWQVEQEKFNKKWGL